MKPISTFNSLRGNLLIRIIQFVQYIFYSTLFFLFPVAFSVLIEALRDSLPASPEASANTLLKVLLATSSQKHIVESGGSGARSWKAL